MPSARRPMERAPKLVTRPMPHDKANTFKVPKPAASRLNPSHNSAALKGLNRKVNAQVMTQ